MKVGTLIEASSRGQELRYVTAHFRDLQGLRMAPFWAALLALTILAKSGSFSKVHLAWAAAVLIAAQFGWLHLSGRWYERRYGIVKKPQPPVPSGLISIMHPEAQSQRASYGYHSGSSAVIFLIWALTLLPGLFHGHALPGYLVMMVAAFQIVPRCFYPVTNSGIILLRRVLAGAALIAIVGIYLEYRFAWMDLWTWMATLFSVLLLLDLYDHWLLNHLLSGGSMEWSDE